MIWKKLPLYILMASFLVLNIYAQHIAFRLDLLMIPLLFLQFFILKKNNLKLILKIIFTLIFLIIGILIHEVYFLIASFPLFYILYFKLGRNRWMYCTVVFLPSLVVFLLMVILFKGNVSSADNIILSWERLGVNPKHLSYLRWLFSLKGPIYIIYNVAFVKNKFYLVGFLLNYILVCLCFYLYIKQCFFVNKRNTIFILGNFSMILILCCIATDFVRWYYMVFLVILFYFVLFEKRKSFFINKKYLILKIFVLFLGLPMYGWTFTHFYWTSPIKYIIELKKYF
ncbi:hypothetical protein [Riemerella columbipharyngis]|nr:hypothetical protein [Riemerella columbipharyngis]